MTPEDWQRIKRITAEAGERAEKDRPAFLSAACAGNAALRLEVESLLRSMDDAADLYERPALSMTAVADALVHAAGARVSSGDRIGSYRVVRELGRGGMGSVYLADRADGEFEQQAAIKFVGGIASEALLRRFREERRILAALHHPHIARLLDAGTTPGGRPYVVMEYVAGLPVDDFCEAHQLDLRERIVLFQRICAAVQYAHQRLVVHRDIKAANILVTADGTPKLLDFGIATMIETEAAGSGRQATLLRALTPESASPEQMRGEAVTIAVDVYSLGVLLYRLVSGRSPYGDADLSDAALLRAICEEMPAPPGIDRDVDVIVLKSLRKEPERRYNTVEQFSDDLTRYLAGRPVLAAPDSRTYRAGKFLRRHGSSVAAAVVALAAILAGAGAAVYQAGVAQRERGRAEQRFADVRRLANAFVFDFHDAIADLPGTLTARQLVANRAAQYLDSLAREAQGDVTLQRELATAYQRLGDALGGPGLSNLGDLKGALSRYEEAKRIRGTIARQAPEAPADVEGMAELQIRLSRVFIAQGDFDRAEATARDALTRLNARMTTPAARERYSGLLATVYQTLGFVQKLRGDTTAGLESLSHALTHGQASVDAHRDQPREIARLARIQADHGELLLNAGRPDEALRSLRTAQKQLEGLIASDPASQRYQLTLLLVLNLQGLTFSSVKDVRGALAVFEQAARLADALRTGSPADQGHRFGALYTHHLLGVELVRAGNHASGLQHLRGAISEAEAAAKLAPDNDLLGYELATLGVDLGETILAMERRPEAACREAEPGLRAWRDLAARGRLPGIAPYYTARFEALSQQCKDP